MHSTPARTAHRGRAALIGWFKALMTVAGIVLSCWAPVVGASAVTAAPAACQVPAEASQGDARFVSAVKPGSMSVGNNSGQTFNTASRTDRPRLSFDGWKDGSGKPLNANNGDAGTVLPIEIRVGAPGTEGQVKTIYPVFTDGRSDYDMSLWYFTEGMDPHQGRYEIGYRVAGTGDFSTAATLSLNVQLAEPAKDAILTLSDGVLSGSGWAFDGNRSITGEYKIRLRLLDAGGGQTDVVVPVEFADGVFSLNASGLTDLGPSGGVYGIRALSAEGDVIDSASVGFAPSATLASGDAYSAGDDITLDYSGWATLDGVQIADPVYTVNGGSIEFDGQDITGLSPDKRSRAGLFLSFQAPVEIPGVPLSSFLRASVAGREGADLKGKQFRKLLKDLCEELDMDPAWLDRELGVGFSGGEKKKVEMLQLLLLQPKLAILDETDSGLDVDALGVVSRGMEAYRRRCNGTLMVITHNTRILEHLSIDRVHVMMGGHMIAEGDASMVQSIDENGALIVAG